MSRDVCEDRRKQENGGHKKSHKGKQGIWYQLLDATSEVFQQSRFLIRASRQPSAGLAPSLYSSRSEFE
jgi:hypothetical protein